MIKFDRGDLHTVVLGFIVGQLTYLTWVVRDILAAIAP